MSALPAAFDATPLELALDRLLPSRPLPKDLTATRKYEQIKASMQEIGLIEPLSVTAADRRSGLHMVLDGHLRLHAARELGYDKIACLCARDDEGFTYNKRVNRLATVQEHYMLLRALERGVSEDRLARALALNIESIVLLGFAVMLWLVIREEVPANQRDMVTLLLGTLAGMASSVVAYWVGSSNGSMQKNAAIERAIVGR